MQVQCKFSQEDLLYTFSGAVCFFCLLSLPHSRFFGYCAGCHCAGSVFGWSAFSSAGIFETIPPSSLACCHPASFLNMTLFLPLLLTFRAHLLLPITILHRIISFLPTGPSIIHHHWTLGKIFLCCCCSKKIIPSNPSTKSSSAKSHYYPLSIVTSKFFVLWSPLIRLLTSWAVWFCFTGRFFCYVKRGPGDGVFMCSHFLRHSAALIHRAVLFMERFSSPPLPLCLIFLILFIVLVLQCSTTFWVNLAHAFLFQSQQYHTMNLVYINYHHVSSAHSQVSNGLRQNAIFKLIHKKISKVYR